MRSDTELLPCVPASPARGKTRRDTLKAKPTHGAGSIMGNGRAAPRQRPLAIGLRGCGRDVEKLITLWALVNHALVFHRENTVNGTRCVVWWLRPRLSPKVPGHELLEESMASGSRLCQP